MWHLPGHETCAVVQIPIVCPAEQFVLGVLHIFRRSLPVSKSGNCHLLVCTEHLTGRPIVSSTGKPTHEEMRTFWKPIIMSQFGPLGAVVSNSAACFTVHVLQNIMKMQGTRWHTVRAYAQSSNGRIGGGLKRSSPVSFGLWSPKENNGIRR